ncbi:MerR family transcriptional regulator [Eubacterium sp. am_0171]|uniref:HTH-type transcriptional regulator AdhR n=1 Tax=Faecalicatena contorta TaxID=39482 RepID=A0A173ZEK8_9FIRM|nr:MULTISPECIES: MerR family transcriptional regulator [Clostridia]MSC86158.1 MerR family transcriptional regulator [Eubacterium sp. BIOML-A1]MSD07027.1 MerR family transcriptional regulator [Eubacterium sp. BIOML-A2]RYT16681.1 MerR family transcriptional regulator [Eubacterium sp. am_0171]CUN74213.1 HTH-type transcriptional regulator AdhR [[Eubacterium] contortum] [Faecalicatena contorta]
MKNYTIKDAAKKMNVPASTIRYYDKSGLLPFMERSESGYRLFTEKDIATLRIIDCLKKTGMPIKEIRQFSEWLQEGDASLQQRYEMFLERKRAVESQMAELQEIMDTIKHKCWYYETAIAAGTEKIHSIDIPNDQLACETK